MFVICVQTSVHLLYCFLGIEQILQICRFYSPHDGDSMAGIWEGCSQKKHDRVRTSMCTSSSTDQNASGYKVNPNIFSQVSVGLG